MCLELEVKRLRLLLHRRVLWLRTQWKQDPLQSYQSLVISDSQADTLLAEADRQAELQFFGTDAEASEISRLVAEVEREIDHHNRVMDEPGAMPALEVLVQLFGLTTFEQDLVLLCLAPEIDPAFERLYAYVQDDVTRKFATLHLALTIFGGEKESWLAARRSLLPDGTLRRFRLITIESGLAPSTAACNQPLRLDPRVAEYLLGFNRPDERVEEMLRPLPPPLLATPHRVLVDHVLQWIHSGAGNQRPFAVNLIGRPGAGKSGVAQIVCEHLRLRLFKLNWRRLPLPGVEREDLLRILERETVLLQVAFYLDAPEPDLGDKQAEASIRDLIERLNAFLIVGSRERFVCDRAMLTAQLPKPDAAAQREMWRQALTRLPESSLAEDEHAEVIDQVVQQFDFGPAAILQAVTAATDRAHLASTGESASVTDEHLWQACREQGAGQPAELAQRIFPCYTWDDIVLPADVHGQLREIAAQVAHRSRVYDQWGFGAKLSRGRGISALFAGPSGTGKTMAAEVLANHLRLDLYRIDLSGVVNKYIGETEKNLRKVFDYAEQSGAILFFDEADALFGKRSEVKDSHDRYANIEVNYLLQRMEDYRGLVILATNMKAHLDQAFIRRLRFVVEFPFPDADLRRCIWQKVFPAAAAVDGIDFNALSRLEVPGGNIKNIAVNAAFLAANEDISIGMTHVMHATRREYGKMEKLMTEAEFGRYYSTKRL